jgi:Flp pilus assembly protein TadG
MIGKIKKIWRHYLADESGAVLAETLVVLPFVTVFAIGILEFGNMLWQKQQLETGLRDAARYVARCQASATFGAACNNSSYGPNIAVYGNTAGTGPARVPGWSPSDVTITTTTKPDGIVVRAETDHDYSTSPLYGALGLGTITIEAFHEERYIGW